MTELGSFFEERFGDLLGRLVDLESRVNEILPNSYSSEDKDREEYWERSQYRRTISLGTVVDNRDKFLLGRIRVRVHGVHSQELDEEKLLILEPIHPFGGLDDSGSNWVPPVGSQVAIVFVNSDLIDGYYLGTVPQGEILDHDGQAKLGQRSIRLFDKRWSSETYNYRNDGHLGSLDNEALPPWASESYRVAQNSVPENTHTAEPTIFGLKSPEKHLLKFCDGFPEEKLMGKRVVLQSSKGNLLYMKDDLLNAPNSYELGSPVAVPDPPSTEAEESPGKAAGGVLRGNLYETYPIVPEGEGDPWDKIDHTNNDHVIVSGTLITSGLYLEDNQGDGRSEPEGPPSAYRTTNILPKTGAILQSVMGHRLIFDDNFDDKSAQDSDNAYSQFRRITEEEDLRSFAKLESLSEHSISLSDHEVSGLRSRFNGIFIETASGNTLALCDHMQSESIRGSEMGAVLKTTSGHTIRMSDGGGSFESPKRKKFGKSEANGENAKFIVKSGFGHIIEMNDGENQSSAGNQSLTILQPSEPAGSGDASTSNANYIKMMNANDGEQHVFLIKAAQFRIDTTKDHLVRNIGGLEIIRRNRGCVEINKDYGESFEDETGELAPSMEFASIKMIQAEQPIILFGGNEELKDSLEKTSAEGADQEGGAGGAAGQVEQEPPKQSIARVLISATDSFSEDSEAPPPAIECPMMKGSGYGCIYIGQDKTAHISPGVFATRQNP